MNRLMHRLLVHLVDIICGQDVSHAKTEGERHQITMSNVTAAISVSLVGPSSPNLCLIHLSEQHRSSTSPACQGQTLEECNAGDALHRPPPLYSSISSAPGELGR